MIKNACTTTRTTLARLTAALAVDEVKGVPCLPLAEAGRDGAGRDGAVALEEARGQVAAPTAPAVGAAPQRRRRRGAGREGGGPEARHPTTHR